MRTIILIACASLLAACTSGEQKCYEAERAFAEATDHFLAADNKSAKEVWLNAHLAAMRWRDSVCPKKPGQS